MADQNTLEMKKIYVMHLDVIFSDYGTIRKKFLEKKGREPEEQDMEDLKHRRKNFLTKLPIVLKEIFRTDSVHLKSTRKYNSWDMTGLLHSNGDNIFRVLVEGHSLNEKTHPHYAESKKILDECDNATVKYTMEREGPMLKYEQWLKEKGQPDHVEETITFK